MEQLQVVQTHLKYLYQQYPIATKVLLGITGIYVVNKVCKTWIHSQKIFNDKQEIQDKVVIITGCDTGFGNAMALKLSIEIGFRVIATCLKQESVNNFLSNSKYTKNKSTATVLDVTNIDNMNSVYEFTSKYLNETNSTLWSVVNNAGVVLPGSFEMVPTELDLFQRNVLFNAPLNMIRTFLPMLPGRMNYKQKIFGKNGGGRIINISSASAKLIFDTRYGVSKAALSYFTHSLRNELSPKFGIWATVIEPGGYNTQMYKVTAFWGKKIKKKLEQNKRTELIDVYDWDLDKIVKIVDDMASFTDVNLTPVVDCVIHGLTAKYPKREYKPGWNAFISLWSNAPWWMTEMVPIFKYL